MLFIKLIYESFCRSLIRFFDNRFIRDTSVDYYRIEMDKLRQEKDKLLEVLIAKTQPLSANVGVEPESVDWQPAKEAYKPWHVMQRELENASRLKAEALAREVKAALNSTKTTAELEAELLGEE